MITVRPGELLRRVLWLLVSFLFSSAGFKLLSDAPRNKGVQLPGVSTLFCGVVRNTGAILGMLLSGHSCCPTPRESIYLIGIPLPPGGSGALYSDGGRISGR